MYALQHCIALQLSWLPLKQRRQDLKVLKLLFSRAHHSAFPYHSGPLSHIFVGLAMLFGVWYVNSSSSPGGWQLLTFQPTVKADIEMIEHLISCACSGFLLLSEGWLIWWATLWSNLTDLHWRFRRSYLCYTSYSLKIHPLEKSLI